LLALFFAHYFFNFCSNNFFSVTIALSHPVKRLFT